MQIRPYLNHALIAVALVQAAIMVHVKFFKDAKPVVVPVPVAQTAPAAVVEPAPLPAPTTPLAPVVMGPAPFVEPARLLVDPKSHRVYSPKVAEMKLNREFQSALATHKRHQHRRASYKPSKGVKTKAVYKSALRRSPVKNKRAVAAVQNYDSLESVLGPDAIRTSNELIAENNGSIPRERLTVAREIGIRDHDFRKIWQKEQDLKKRLRQADNSGASGMRRILIEDHNAWMREFLGRGRFERYMEMAR